MSRSRTRLFIAGFPSSIRVTSSLHFLYYRQSYLPVVCSFQTSDLEDKFRRYGRIIDCLVKGVFGFVEFDDERDAEDAVRDLHGTKLGGDRITVEFAKRGLKRGEPMAEARCFKCHETGHL